ncbi:MAG: T9SS type A sorting domain-containing protein [Bacteroidia bacterium]
MHKYFLIFILIFSVLRSSGQGLPRYDAILFSEDGDTLDFPFAGGLNQPQFSAIDFNGDLRDDLFVFDRAGNKVLTFLSVMANGQLSYQYAPQYQSQFPPMVNWALMADYDCDGKADLLTSSGTENGIMIYHNESSSQGLQFSLVETLLYTTDSIKVYNATSDIPAFADIDEDGDMDILAFDPSGLFVRYYERLGTNNCQDLNFALSDDCWGQFMEAGLNNDIILNTNCKGGGSNSGVRHAGSTLCVVDLDGDGAKDLLLGDLNYSNIVLVENGGTPQSAQMNNVDISFPSNDLPVDIFIFPAVFHIDIDQDGKKDLVAASNASGTAVNHQNVFYYRNTSTNNTQTFVYQERDFLENQMVDCGESSFPTFFDYNGDGLMDIVVGNYLYREGLQADYAGLTLYENVGTPTLAAYKLISRDYLQLGNRFNPPVFGLKPTFGDLDDDGDQDMILGDSDGKIHFFRNDAAPNQEANFLLFGPQYQGIDVGQQAAPILYDVNQDNLLDLVIGEQAGNLNYYENTGTATAPIFANGDNKFGDIDVQAACCTGFSVPFLYEDNNNETQLVLGAESGALYHFDQIDGNLGGAFSERNSQFGEIKEGTRLSIDGADIDQDGALEWIVGNRRGGLAIYEDLGQALTIEKQITAAQNWRIVPNPGQKSRLLLDEISASPQPLKLEIHNLQGALIYSSQSPASAEIFLPQLANGLYLVSLWQNDHFLGHQKWSVF